MQHSISLKGSRFIVELSSGYRWIKYTAQHMQQYQPAPGGRLSHPLCATVLRCLPCHKGSHCLVPENNSQFNIIEIIVMVGSLR